MGACIGDDVVLLEVGGDGEASTIAQAVAKEGLRAILAIDEIASTGMGTAKDALVVTGTIVVS